MFSIWLKIIAVIEVIGGLLGVITTSSLLASTIKNGDYLGTLVGSLFAAAFGSGCVGGIGLWLGKNWGRITSMYFLALQIVYFKLNLFHYVFLACFYSGVVVFENTFDLTLFWFGMPEFLISIKPGPVTQFEWGINFLALAMWISLESGRDHLIKRGSNSAKGAM